MEQPTDQVGLIDTDILIDASRGIEEAGRFLNTMQDGTGIDISVISAMELMAGCRDSRQLSVVRAFISKVEVLHLTVEISMRAESLMERYTLSHGMLLPDALIAATALEIEKPVYTRNIRHFSMIPELAVIKPY